MTFLISIRIALRSLAGNKLRAILTVLGIVIGIAAVTAMVSIGQSATLLVQQQFNSLGTNVIVVLPEAVESGGVRGGPALTLTAGDSAAMVEECPGVLASSPLVGAGGQLIYGNSNWSPREMFGVGPQYLTVRNSQVSRGGFFTERDISSAAKVCVIGQTVVAKLFQTTNPINEKIRINNIPMRVIGVLEEKGANMVGEDQDDVVLLPYTTVRKRLQGSGFDNVDAIMASARSSERMNEATAMIEQLLADRHQIRPGEAADFQVQNMTEIADIVSVVTTALTMMLASIAGISLLVGGVGIMNIMLVSVTERTREIGIRMALGARSRDILRQFLIESALLSAVGGAIGFMIGVGGSVGVTMLINHFSSGSDWPIVVSLPAAGLAVGFASVVGIFFGYYPALRASKMSPIEALRHE
ncbi:ABC transporter permease [Planctomycetaceae bacterium SH139]